MCVVFDILRYLSICECLVPCSGAAKNNPKKHSKEQLQMIYEGMVFLLRHVGTQHSCAGVLTGIQWGPAHAHEHKTLGPASYLVGDAIATDLLTSRVNDLAHVCFGVERRSGVAVKNYLRWVFCGHGTEGAPPVAYREYREIGAGLFEVRGFPPPQSFCAQQLLSRCTYSFHVSLRETSCFSLSTPISPPARFARYLSNNTHPFYINGVVACILN